MTESRPIDVICGGIIVADHIASHMEALPRAGELVAVETMSLLTGGCALNVAIDLSKQDVQCGVIGKVGRDVWGGFIREDLSRWGIESDRIGISDRFPTSQTMVLLCRSEDRRFVHTFGANRDFRAIDIDRDYIRRARVFYLGGYLALPELEPEGVADIFRFCRESGVTTVLDVVVSSQFKHNGELQTVLPHTDVFLPNNDEAFLLTGRNDPAEQALALSDWGARTVVITLGPRGTVTRSSGRLVRSSAFSVDSIDPTGGGDAFAAGYIVGLLKGWSLEGCLGYASALGASCTRATGCHEGVFTASEAEAFLESNHIEITSS